MICKRRIDRRQSTSDALVFWTAWRFSLPRPWRKLFFCGVAWLGVSLLLPASNSAHSGENLDSVVINTQDFLDAHPDMRYRAQGAEAYRDQDYGKALELFRSAARYADKPSQNILGIMYWNGQGCSEDHILGYSWMNLAAERGYVGPSRMRDIYWKALNAKERKKAVDQYEKLKIEYGDSIAKQRLDTDMRFALSHGFGSHPALKSSTATIQVKDQAGIFRSIDTTVFYNPKFWQSKEYWEWQDKLWKKPSYGHVEVLPIEMLPDGKK